MGWGDMEQGGGGFSLPREHPAPYGRLINPELSSLGWEGHKTWH